MVIEVRIEITGENVMVLTGKGHEKSCCGNGKVLYLYLDSVYISVNICKNFIPLFILLSYPVV